MRFLAPMAGLLLITGCTVAERNPTELTVTTPTTAAITEQSTNTPTSASSTTTQTNNESLSLFTTMTPPPNLVDALPTDMPSTVIALDIDSGEPMWELPVPQSPWHWTQLVDDRIIHSSTRWGDASAIAAIGLDGKPLWQVTTPLQTHGPFLIDQGLLIGSGELPESDADTHVLFALDLDHGELRWSMEIDWRPQWGEQGPVVGDNGVAYVAGSFGEIIALETQTGVPFWQTDLDSELIDAPLPVAELLLVGGYRGMVALDAASGEAVWSTPLDGRLIASPEGLSDGTAVAWHGNLETGFEISGINIDDGSVAWTDSCYRQFEVFDEFVVGFAPDPAFDWPQSVRVWDGRTGVLLAEEPLGANIDPFSISSFEAMVYAGTNSGELAAIDVAAGRLDWSIELSGEVALTTANAGFVYVSARDRQAEMQGAVYAIDRTKGTVMWSTDFAREARTAPLPTGDLVIVVLGEEQLGTF